MKALYSWPTRFLLLLLACGFALGSFAADGASAREIERAQNAIDTIREKIIIPYQESSEQASLYEIDQALDLGNGQLIDLRTCVDKTKTKLKSVRSTLEQLLPEEDENPDIDLDDEKPSDKTTRSRRKISERLKKLRGQESQLGVRKINCELLARDYESLIDRLQDIRNETLIAGLTTKSFGVQHLLPPPSSSKIKSDFQELIKPLESVWNQVRQQATLFFVIIPLLLICGIVLFFQSRDLCHKILNRLTNYETEVKQLMARTIAQTLCLCLLLGSFAGFTTLQFSSDEPEIGFDLVSFAYLLVSYAIACYVISLNSAEAKIQLWRQQIQETGKIGAALSKAALQRAFLAMVWFSIVTASFISFVLLDVSVLVSETNYLLQVARFITQLTALTLLLVGCVTYFRLSEKTALKGSLLLIAIATIVVALIANSIGYTPFGYFIIKGFSGTLVVALALRLITKLIDHVFSAFTEPDHQLNRFLRATLKVESEEGFTGIYWLQGLMNAAIYFLCFMAVLWAWGLGRAGFNIVNEWVFIGFSVGQVTVTPVKIFSGAVVFTLLLAISKWVADKITRGQVVRSSLEPSSRETVLKLLTYIGFILAAVFGLSTAGFDFQNLAIVAGALSVGIGFGLQNIVNNFVSGIIMLFERPVRKGDWVVVGGTEGFIKNIRVRATEVQTWDRVDVVIPNSEFISSQVHNYTLKDKFGRVICPVGVAYGSDTQKVKEILLETLEGHNNVIRSHPLIPPPLVLFMEFGDSSLNFELRFYIRDITQKLIISSEINFEIDRRFREAGIEIPFPQRDINFRPQDLETLTQRQRQDHSDE